MGLFKRSSGGGSSLQYQLSERILQPLLPGARGVGDTLMAGKAAKHVASLGRQLVIVGDPGAVTAHVREGVERCGRFTAVEAEGSELAAWTAESSFGPFPRIAVLPSEGHEGRSLFGVDRFVWRMRFPQGSGFFDRAWSPVLDAVNTAGLESYEQAGTFEFSAAAADDPPDGEWRLAAAR
jgi:hypothetical protein